MIKLCRRRLREGRDRHVADLLVSKILRIHRGRNDSCPLDHHQHWLLFSSLNHHEMDDGAFLTFHQSHNVVDLFANNRLPVNPGNDVPRSNSRIERRAIVENGSNFRAERVRAQPSSHSAKIGPRFVVKRLCRLRWHENRVRVAQRRHQALHRRILQIRLADGLNVIRQNFRISMLKFDCRTLGGSGMYPKQVAKCLGRWWPQLLNVLPTKSKQEATKQKNDERKRFRNNLHLEPPAATTLDLPNVGL